MSHFFEAIILSAAAGAVATTLFSFVTTLSAIRMKASVAKHLHDLAVNNAELTQLMEITRMRHLQQDEVEHAKALLRQAAASLEDRERVVLRDGIEQSSRAGERRFIESLLAA